MLSPASKDFQTYYTDLGAITAQGVPHEQAALMPLSTTRRLLLNGPTD